MTEQTKFVTKTGCTVRVNDAPEHMPSGIMLEFRMEQPDDDRRAEIVFTDDEWATVVGHKPGLLVTLADENRRLKEILRELPAAVKEASMHETVYWTDGGVRFSGHMLDAAVWNGRKDLMVRHGFGALHDEMNTTTMKEMDGDEHQQG